MNKGERMAIKVEIKGCKELLRRLGHPLKLLQAAEAKAKAQREERVAQNREYQTIQEAQDAYGWAIITEDEYNEIVKAIESGNEYIENVITYVEVAAEILREFINRLSSDVRSLEFELLPIEEQVKRMEAAENRRKEIEARRATRKLG